MSLASLHSRLLSLAQYLHNTGWDNKELSVPQISPISLMFTLFVGLGISAAYGLLGFVLSSYLGGNDDGRAFFAAYTTSFKTILSLGLILGIAGIVYKYQQAIAETIRAAFNEAELSATEYYRYEHRFFSTFRSVTFSAEFILIAWIVFSYARFPLSQPGEALMMIAVCTEYALGVYVGRKLRYASEMLQSLLNVPVTRNLFRKRELDVINSYVHVASTLMLIFGYIHVVGYYEGPFRYDSILGQSIKPFLLIPVIIGTPVLLIFNFYPRTVLRKLYSRSIDFEACRLKKAMANASLSLYEKRSYLIEFKRMSREELRYSLQLTLSDLPIGITILIAAIQSLMRR
jgi:hypothetical protein